MGDAKDRRYRADVVIVGAGLAGLAAASELLDQNKDVLIIERDLPEHLGGLAKLSFGGVCMVGTPYQKKAGIADSAELAMTDWFRYGEIPESEHWPRRWVEKYVNESDRWIYSYLNGIGVKFLPVVNWPERGMFVRGNSVPRWHIAWGTGYGIIEQVVKHLFSHRNANKLRIEYGHRVEELIREADGIGCRGALEKDVPDAGASFVATGDALIIAAGGICGGDLSYLRTKWSDAPKRLLNGSHRYADGTVHEAALRFGANLTHLEKQWHYAAGIATKEPIVPHHGLSLVPPRSALWVNAHGDRIGPHPNVGYTDTHYLVQNILKEPGSFSYQVMNYKIAIKELAVSGSEHMTAFRNKSKLGLIKGLLFGNRALLERLKRESDDVFIAGSIDELVTSINAVEKEYTMDKAKLTGAIRQFDAEIERGEKYIGDEQLRRMLNHRTYRGDRMRMSWMQKIDDAKAYPLVAFRESILSRKSLGGIQTDLQSRVLDKSGEPIPGLYAAGEAAGYGGGGIHGMRSLEGTFLGGCIITGRVAGNTAGGRQ
ncbi:MAG: FAD-dependent oxidoreductase [Leptonema illini]|uniref:FAD-dependent oxidoreductase n=1 Tax=Leptonema illini TaxID=183 RepID=A0A833H429_9LEPT|nr:MAG: FAD-dependent oxidoreductase [Leptonema illini]